MKLAADYVAGAITFDAFARANQTDWRAMARYLLRRFPVDQVAEDDVVQELLLGSWLALSRFDPTRGVAADRYCTFNALRQTKRRLCRMLRPPEEQLGDGTAAAEPVLPAEQQAGVERGERLRQLIDQCGTLKDAVVLLAFFKEEDRTLTAAALYRDPEMRRLCRFGSEEEARRKVRQTLAAVNTRNRP